MNHNLLKSTATVGLMLDIETLGDGPNAVAWQSALYGWDLKDPETLFDLPHHQYLPVQPQLLMSRTVNFQTLLFWMREVGKNPGIIEDFVQADSTDYEELASSLRHLIRTFERYTMNGMVDYELWTRGNFDLPIMETLLRACGLEVPWDFRKTRDLRTLEAVSGVSYKDVTAPLGFIKHRADWDCRFQILHHAACNKALGAAKVN